MLSAIAILALILPLPDGTIIYLEHSNRIVERHSNSSITHVGIVSNDRNGCWVYEADKPRIRRWTLFDYYKVINDERDKGRPIKMIIMVPKKPLLPAESIQMKAYLDSVIGTPYSIYSYVHGVPAPQGTGLHCGEVVAHALEKTGRYKFDNPCRVLPVDIYNKTKAEYEKRALPTIMQRPAS